MQKGNILAIEGDKATQRWMDSLLSQAGYTVEFAKNGEDGIQMASRNTFNLIILDLAFSDLTCEQVFDSIRRNQMIEIIPFIIFAEKIEQSGMERLLQKGFDDYIAKRPDVELELLKSVEKTIKDPRPVISELKTGRMISFFSAKGGNGTSTLCNNIAHSLANQVSPETVLVVDLVLPMGTLAMMNGINSAKSIIEMTTMDVPCDPNILKECIEFDEIWNFHFIRGSGAPQESQTLNPDKLNLLFAQILQMYDYILVDLGKNLSRISLPILKKSGFVVTVFGADLVTADLTQRTMHYLEETGIQKKKLFPILNRAVGREGLTKAEIEQKFDISIQRAIPFAANKFNHANNQRVPYIKEFPEDIVSMVLNDIAKMMIGHDTGSLEV